MDHRWGERIKVDFPVRLVTHAFSRRDARLMDLSVSGAYILTNIFIRPHSRVEVALLASPWARHEAVVVSGYVTRRYRAGVGIEWCEFAPPPIGSLLHSVARRRYSFTQRPPSRTALTIARLSGSLLKHPP